MEGTFCHTIAYNSYQLSRIWKYKPFPSFVNFQKIKIFVLNIKKRITDELYHPSQHFHLKNLAVSRNQHNHR